jgi:hypothetical protein
MLPLAGLCVWMLLSTIWASDKFAAIITACHWTAAMSLAWAASQLVRDWARLRLVAAACVGLLGLYVVQAANYRFIEVPALQRQWNDQKNEILAQRGYAPDSFLAHQLGKKIMAGEMMGFTNSPDAFGEILALLCVIAAGVLISCISESNAPASVGTALLLALGLGLTGLTYSKTALATPFLAAVLFLLVWRGRAGLRRDARMVFWIGAGLVVALCLGVVRYGMTHGNLPGKSMTFRWYYWVGAAKAMHSSLRLFFLGTGWSNFGRYYLQFRLPQAPEEVKDPHCMVVRFFVELGVVGGLLMAAWLLRLWWELTQEMRPTAPSKVKNDAPPGPISVMGFMSLVVTAMVGLTFWLSADLSQSPSELIFKSGLRLAFGAVLLIASVLAAARSLRDGICDDRPAPWILWGMLVGLGMFLVGNLVDYSLFESGPLIVFAMVAGSVLGMRQMPAPTRRPGAFFALICATAMWLALLMGVWMPTNTSEQSAAEADQLLRDNHTGRAMAEYVDAAQQQPLNADYMYRAFRAAVYDRASLEQQLELISEAIAADPRHELYYLSRAHCQATASHPDIERARSDFRTALELDPNNMEARVEYARTLVKWAAAEVHAEVRQNYEDEARQQYKLALAVNDKMPSDEVRRLEAQKVKEAQDALKNARP